MLGKAVGESQQWWDKAGARGRAQSLQTFIQQVEFVVIPLVVDILLNDFRQGCKRSDLLTKTFNLVFR